MKQKKLIQKMIFLFLAATFLLSGCNTDIQSTEISSKDSSYENSVMSNPILLEPTTEELLYFYLQDTENVEIVQSLLADLQISDYKQNDFISIFFTGSSQDQANYLYIDNEKKILGQATFAERLTAVGCYYYPQENAVSWFQWALNEGDSNAAFPLSSY